MVNGILMEEQHVAIFIDHAKWKFSVNLVKCIILIFINIPK